jgi:hypothetical protein
MKTIFFSLLVTSITLISCKKESQNTATNSDSITTPDTVSKIPASAPVDTLVAAPKSDTASLKKDSAK